MPSYFLQSLSYCYPCDVYLPVVSRATGSRRQVAQGLHSTCAPPTPMHLLKPAMYEANVSYLRSTMRGWLTGRLRTTRQRYESQSCPTMLIGNENTSSCVGFCKIPSVLSPFPLLSDLKTNWQICHLGTISFLVYVNSK